MTTEFEWRGWTGPLTYSGVTIVKSSEIDSLCECGHTKVLHRPTNLHDEACVGVPLEIKNTLFCTCRQYSPVKEQQ